MAWPIKLDIMMHLASPSPFIFAILLGLIGAVGTFIFGALQIPGPASIYFVIVFAMTSASHADPSLAPLRAGLVLLGGAFAWLVAMTGWFFNPHGPETNAVKKVYVELATLMLSVGTEQYNAARERTVLALRKADTTLLAGYISWKSSTNFKKLYLVKEQANSILSDIFEMAAEGRTKLMSELAETVQTLAHSLDHKKNRKPINMLQLEEMDSAMKPLFSKIYEAEQILNEPFSKIKHEINIKKPTLHKIFLDAFDKNSIVFLSSVKYGVVLMIAALIAFGIEFNRSYWIPVSCGSVMLGSTIMFSFKAVVLFLYTRCKIYLILINGCLHDARFDIKDAYTSHPHKKHKISAAY